MTRLFHKTQLMQILVMVYIVAVVSTETTESVSSFYYISSGRNLEDTEPDKMEALFGSNLTINCPIVNTESPWTMSMYEEEMEEDTTTTSNPQAQQFPIYSIKWFKLINATFYEFYSYIANPERKIHHQPLPGIKLDLEETMTNQGEMVKLIDVDLDTEGVFRCEVISDVTFQIERKEFDLTVLIPALEAPTILGTRQMYGIGERVQLRCITGASRPAPNIRWLINDIPVPNSYIIPWSNADNTSKLSDSHSQLQTPVNQSHKISLNSRHIDYEYSLIAINQPNQSSTNGVVGHSNLSLSFEPVTTPSSSLSSSTHHPNHYNAASTNNNSSQRSNQKSVAQNSSQLDFKLRHEHLIDGGKRFSVQCVAYLDARFYPEAQNSKVIIDSWHEATPVLVGLRKQYALGDLVDLNCTIPAFYSPDLPNGRQTNDGVYESVQISWFINEIPANPSYVRHYFTYGNVGLRFRLRTYHLGADLSLSIKCKSIQKWPTHQLSHLKQLSLHTRLYQPPPSPLPPRQFQASHKPHSQHKQFSILLEDDEENGTKLDNSQTTTTATTIINESDIKIEDVETTAVTTTTAADQQTIDPLNQRVDVTTEPTTIHYSLSTAQNLATLLTISDRVADKVAVSVTPSVTDTNQLELTTNQNQGKSETTTMVQLETDQNSTTFANSTESLFSIVKQITKTQPQVLRSFGFAMIPVAVMAVVFFVG